MSGCRRYPGVYVPAKWWSAIQSRSASDVSMSVHGPMAATGRNRSVAIPKLSAAHRFQAARARVPRLERVRAVRGVVEHVAEAEVAVVDELGGDALTIHVGQAQVRVVQPVVPIGVRVLDLGQARAAPPSRRAGRSRSGRPRCPRAGPATGRGIAGRGTPARARWVRRRASPTRRRSTCPCHGPSHSLPIPTAMSINGASPTSRLM